MDCKQNTLSLVALVIAVVAAGASFSNTGEREFHLVDESSQDKTISVSGESERFVAPDTAGVSFSMTRKDKDLSVATDSVNARVGDMVAGLSEFGIKESDIKTTSYNVKPEYNYVRNSGERTFDGYRVTQSIELKIRDLAQASTILTAVSGFEVDKVSGLSFYVDEDQEIRDELRSEAISDAKDKARDLARDLGIELDEIVGFSEGGGGYYGGSTQDRFFNFESAAFDVEEASIPTGETSYQSRVTVTFSID